jgi:small ligand-binding sensory domain FIST
MPFAAALSTSRDSGQALDAVCDKALAQLGTAPHLALLFFSPHHTAAAARLATTARRRLEPACLIGCPGESIVGNDQEIEEGPAMSLWLAKWNAPLTLPSSPGAGGEGRVRGDADVSLSPFHLVVEETPDGFSLLGWPDALASADPAQSLILMVADPFTFPVDAFLQQVNEEHRGLRVMGGMASGLRGAGDCTLLLSDRVVDEGAVGVLLQGPVKIRGVVSQGCRPIGRHMIVTKGHDNIITGLGGKTPLQQLEELWQELNPRDQRLLQQGLHIGRVINEYQGEFQRGDFLIRNVMGLDRDSGALAITDRVRVGQTVQFHVRDADSADEDLHALLQIDLNAHERKPAGALLFTCNGRGTRLFAERSHDARAIRAEAGALPLTGFFAQGEFGPVGGQNFIHGFTASVVLFED